MTSPKYNLEDDEFAAAVAATAFFIYSQEVHHKTMRQDVVKSKLDRGTRKEEHHTVSSSANLARRASWKEVKDTGEVSVRRPNQQDQRLPENGLSSRKPSHSSSSRNAIDARHNANSSRRHVETGADSWEMAQLRKLNKWNEKQKSNILDWENAKKMQVNLHMERKKTELELRMERNLQHYKNKLARIELIADGARRQLEEKRRNEESEVKEKAKYRGSKGRNPMKCFCC
ncbi:hypothetical protein K2173_019737 [Erythroxylum novogranatense]|uniref:Remorin C-terminal domain-containing protein n=1 Tax=Erythroxylum novogranatense TaxID=1862640 RepID=A0AAV8SMS1_9ROSI|nr:hypothetical protein K2173_019737 [Erythroxylum novogranatense]